MNSKINFNTIILVLILITLVFVIVGGFALISTVRHLSQPLERVERALEEQVEEMAQRWAERLGRPEQA